MVVEPSGSQYVLGDVEIPPETHVLRDVVATGMLRVGDGCLCEGNLVGGRGVSLGRKVTVRGDVVSSGSVHLGPGAVVEGRVRTIEAVESPAKGPSRSSEMLPGAIQATVNVLLDVAIEAQRRGIVEGPDSWWGLEWPAVEATVDGLRGLLAETYRNGDGSLPWATDEVFEILLQRVVGSALAVSVTRKGEEYAMVTLGAPVAVLADGSSAIPAGWARPAMSLLALLGRSVHPEFRIALADERSALLPTAAPAKLHAIASVRAMSRDDPGQ